MRKLLFFSLLVSVAFPAIAGAQNGYAGMRDIGGYDGVVCSTFLNNATTGGYRLLSLPAGYDAFRMVRVIPVNSGTAQDCALRFWPGTGDSTGAFVTVNWAASTYGEPYYQYYPCEAKKISLSLIADADDFIIEAYCTRNGTSYGSRGKPDGYDRVKFYNFDDNEGALGTYEKISVPTGYKMIRMVRVVPLAPGAAQNCTLRFWPSSTDSTAGVVTSYWATTVDGEPYNQYYPVNCKAVSVGAAAATDDFYIEVYYDRK